MLVGWRPVVAGSVLGFRADRQATLGSA